MVSEDAIHLGGEECHRARSSSSTMNILASRAVILNMHYFEYIITGNIRILTYNTNRIVVIAQIKHT